MKRAVVGTNISGISEILSDGYNGILCPVGDIDAVVQATLKIHGDVELATRLGEGGYEQASRLFRVEHHGEAVKHVYHRVLGQLKCI